MSSSLLLYSFIIPPIKKKNDSRLRKFLEHHSIYLYHNLIENSSFSFCSGGDEGSCRAASGKLSTGQFSIPPFQLPSTLYHSFK